MACPPFLAEPRKRPLEPLAEQRRALALAARRGEQRRGVDGSQRPEDPRGCGLQVGVDSELLRRRGDGLRLWRAGAGCGRGGGCCSSLPPPPPLLPPRGPFWGGGDPQHPGKSVARRIEFR